MKKGLVMVLALAMASTAFAGTAWYGGIEKSGTVFEQGKLAKWAAYATKGYLEATGQGYSIGETNGDVFYAFPSIDGTLASKANMLKVADGAAYTMQYQWTMPEVLLTGTRNWAPQFFFDWATGNIDPLVDNATGNQGNKTAIQFDYQTSGTNVDKIRVKMKNDWWHNGTLAPTYMPVGYATLQANSWCAGGAGTWPFYIPRTDLAGKDIILKAVRTVGSGLAISMVVDGVNQPLITFSEACVDTPVPAGAILADVSGPDATWMWLKGAVAEDLTLLVTGQGVLSVNATLVGSNGVPSLSVPAFAE